METTIERLREFGALIVEVWRTNVLGVDAGTIVSALAILTIFVLLRDLFTRLVLGRLRRWAERTKTSVDDTAVAALAQPIRFVPLVLGLFFAKEILTFTGTSEAIADGFLKSLVAFVLFWFLHRLVDPLRSLVSRLEEVLTAEVMDWAVRGIKIGLILIGAATILEIWGIQVGPILAGLGLLGVAVALGAQDLFRNLIAGILVIGERRFARGDWIRVDGIAEGIVEEIGFRSTLVRQFDKGPLYVPNAKLSDNALINYSRMTHRRIYWIINVEYRTTIDQLRRIRDGIEAYLLENDEFAHPPEVVTFVRVDRFSDSSIDIMVYAFTVTTVWGEWLAAKERLALKVKEIVEGAGAAFAFPSRSIYIETGGSEAPEIFVPPDAAGD